jgi:hypothetical protein
MKRTDSPDTTKPGKPVFSIAGVMPGRSEAAWKTAYPNPDAGVAEIRPAGHGPSFSIAGVTAGTPETAWRTAMPDPTRDVLDAYGHIITRAEAEARAELAPRENVIRLQASIVPAPEAA